MELQPIQEELFRQIPGDIATPLLTWYDQGNRPLPWRLQPTPYRVWVSEIMLQQTRVTAVLPYFHRWMDTLPTIAALAEAEEETVHKLWEGLGYYSRARNLQKAARIICAQYGGELPGEYEALLTLPGIGEYTAGAVASIAFGQPVPAVDGNVLRVFARLLAWEWDMNQPQIKRVIRRMIGELQPVQRPGDFNQALMELGAMVCLPSGEPLCGRCPLAGHCRGRELEIAASLPVKPEKKPRRVEERTLVVLWWEGKVLLRRRPDRGLLAGLWELPGVEDTLSGPEAMELTTQWGGSPVGEPRAMGKAKHLFSHIQWDLQAWQLETQPFPAPEGWAWATRQELEEIYTLPSAFQFYRSQLMGEETQLRLF